MSQLSLGDVHKAAGQARVDDAESSEWKASADRAIAYLARTGRDFTADDVRKMAGDPFHPNALGARLSAAAKSGLIRTVGHRNADRPSRHSSLMRVWRGRAG